MKAKKRRISGFIVTPHKHGILRALSKGPLSKESPLSYVKNPRTTARLSSHPQPVTTADEKVA